MKNRYSFLVILILMVMMGNVIIAQESSWVAPKYANGLINPLKGKSKSITEGKEIYNQMCVLCHGINGKGNGEAGLTLEKKPANFLSINVIDQSDGAIFWKITVGRAPMASYEDLLTEEQRWNLVNYIRELEKK